MLHKTTVLLLSFLCCVSFLCAQTDDPVAVKVDKEEVLRSELAYYYAKARQVQPTISVVEVAERIALLKMKVLAAREERIHLRKEFLSDFNQQQKFIMVDFLIGRERLDSLAHAIYDKSVCGLDSGMVHVLDYFVPIVQNASQSQIKQAQGIMDEVYESLLRVGEMKSGTGKLVEVREKSIIRDNVLSEMEKVAFSLQEGEYSKPFFTPEGLHILQTVRRKAIPSYEEQRREIMDFLWKSPESFADSKPVIDYLKQSLRYTPNEKSIASLLSSGKSRGTLFELCDKTFSVDDFEKFASVYPASRRKQWSAFVVKALYGAAVSRLEENQQYRFLVREVHDGLLSFAVMKEQVWEREVDQSEWEAFVRDHLDGVEKTQKCYVGMVYHADSKKLLKRVKKLLKSLPEEEWPNAIRLMFNKGSETPHVICEQGRFVQGENPYVDYLIFKNKQKPQPLLQHPYTNVYGRVVQEKVSEGDAREKVEEAYLTYREDEWVKRLKKRFKVEINQEVLKTVNVN